METGEWIIKIFQLIEASKTEEREILLLKLADVAAKLGYSMSFIE